MAIQTHIFHVPLAGTWAVHMHRSVTCYNQWFPKAGDALNDTGTVIFYYCFHESIIAADN